MPIKAVAEVRESVTKNGAETRGRGRVTQEPLGKSFPGDEADAHLPVSFSRASARNSLGDGLGLAYGLLLQSTVRLSSLESRQ